MRKVRSSLINRTYWIGLDASPDGCPVFTHAEVELLKKYRETLPEEVLNKIFDIKAELKCSLMSLDFNNLPETKRGKGLEICRETISMLKGSNEPIEARSGEEQGSARVEDETNSSP